MFTGLVKEIGVISSVTKNAEGIEITVKSNKLISEIEIDDSVAINGACQTAIKTTTSTFTVQAVHTTLDKTTLGDLRPGDEVNLELAMRLSDRLGGHLVQGHVNDIGFIQKVDTFGDNYLITLKVPTDLLKYIVNEGSITLSGISLTIENVESNQSLISVSVIPHTFFNTILKNMKIGSKINIEVDILGKYVENLLFYAGSNNKKQSITQEWLSSKGFS